MIRAANGCMSMGKSHSPLKNPRLFSDEFNVLSSKLDKLDVLDPVLNGDTKLYIDPLLLKSSHHKIIKDGALANFNDYFGRIIKLLTAATRSKAAWKSAETLFKFSEIGWTCLGYGKHSTRGSAIGPGLRAKLMNTAKEIVDLGIDDPEIFALIGLLEEGIGADRISDMTTRAILPSLIKFTEDVCQSLNVSTEPFVFNKFGGLNGALPINPLASKPRTPILLVPRDILRDLPVAADWDGVASATEHNDELRNKVNSMISNIWTMKSKEQKSAARLEALRSKEAFTALIKIVGEAKARPYDPKEDPAGHYLWREILNTVADAYPLKIASPANHGLPAIESVVEQIVAQFKVLIEDNGLWKLLWHDGKPRKEKSAQLLFFAVAEAYCKSNGLDISPEVDAGAGPVDFKFSDGYRARVVVELKMSTGQVVNGYMKQLEIYKKSERNAIGKYIVIDVGKLGNKAESIMAVKNARTRNNLRTSTIYLVDASQRPSASKAN